MCSSASVLPLQGIAQICKAPSLQIFWHLFLVTIFKDPGFFSGVATSNSWWPYCRLHSSPGIRNWPLSDWSQFWSLSPRCKFRIAQNNTMHTSNFALCLTFHTHVRPFSLQAKSSTLTGEHRVILTLIFLFNVLDIMVRSRIPLFSVLLLPQKLLAKTYRNHKIQLRPVRHF